MPLRFMQPMGKSIIKSIQRGTITVNGSTGPQTATATITAVDLANSVVMYGGTSWGQADSISCGNRGEQVEGLVVLTNATTVTGYVWDTTDTGATPLDAVISFTVVEFYPGVAKSVQSARSSIASTNLTATVTLSPSINPAKTMFWCNGINGSTTDSATRCRAVLTNSTTVTLTRASRGANETSYIAWSLVEFF
jgi:hypothetical protein